MKLEFSNRRLLYLLIVGGLLVIIGLFFLLPYAKREHFTPNYVADKVAESVADNENFVWEVTEHATGFEIPWDIVFSPSGELFITERAGKVKVLRSNGRIDTVAQLPQVTATGESGLTGIALHPKFKDNGYLYLYYTYLDQATILNRVSRFNYVDGKLEAEQTIVNGLKGGSIHNGGRMRFGPDNKLWVLTGDSGRPDLAQDPTAPEGKVLRLNDDGSIPADNPTPGSKVYSLGHRNPQGLDWRPLTGELLVSSHGATAFDEINLVTPNSNHGWPLYPTCNEKPPYISAILCSDDETWAPSGIAFYGTDILHLRNSLFFVGLRSGMLERVEIIDGKVNARETIIKGKYGRLRAITRGPDESLYITTSNHDGRGTPQAGDDKILRVTPKNTN